MIPADFDDHDMCPDCRGRGNLKLFTSDDRCPRCEGAGWLSKGSGWSWAEYQWALITDKATKQGQIQ